MEAFSPASAVPVENSGPVLVAGKQYATMSMSCTVCTHAYVGKKFSAPTFGGSAAHDPHDSSWTSMIQLLPDLSVWIISPTSTRGKHRWMARLIRLDYTVYWIHTCTHTTLPSRPNISDHLFIAEFYYICLQLDGRGHAYHGSDPIVFCFSIHTGVCDCSLTAQQVRRIAHFHVYY
jgi:hypothetical protein